MVGMAVIFRRPAGAVLLGVAPQLEVAVVTGAGRAIGAATVVYLASTAGGYVTGKLIEVDGGLQQPNLDVYLADV